MRIEVWDGLVSQKFGNNNNKTLIKINIDIQPNYDFLTATFPRSFVFLACVLLCPETQDASKGDTKRV